MKTQRLLVKNCIDGIANTRKELSRLLCRELFRLGIKLKKVLQGNTVFLNR